MKTTILSLLAVLLITACNRNGNNSDAYGNFEADEWTISAETSGKLITYKISEGDLVKKGDTVAIIDSVQLYLKQKQLEASIASIKQKLPNKGVQVAVFDEQISTLNREVNRISNLVQKNAAPAKQLDDLTSQLELVKRQRQSAVSGIDIQTRGLLSEIEPLRYQLLQTTDQLNKCVIVNPEDGIILTTYLKQSEIAQPGKPIYKLARINPMIVRAYIAGNQLQEVKIGQKISVLTDLPDGKIKTTEGTISWISGEAEFTPKTIQTREERVTQVYAMKIRVDNDGSFKIGMPAEINFGKGK